MGVEWCNLEQIEVTYMNQTLIIFLLQHIRKGFIQKQYTVPQPMIPILIYPWHNDMYVFIRLGLHVMFWNIRKTSYSHEYGVSTGTRTMIFYMCVCVWVYGPGRGGLAGLITLWPSKWIFLPMPLHLLLQLVILIEQLILSLVHTPCLHLLSHFFPHRLFFFFFLNSF